MKPVVRAGEPSWSVLRQVARGKPIDLVPIEMNP